MWLKKYVATSALKMYKIIVSCIGKTSITTNDYFRQLYLRGQRFHK
jgi:hypothetical protein